MSDALGRPRETSSDLRGGFGGQYFAFPRDDEEEEKDEDAPEESDPAPVPCDRVVLRPARCPRRRLAQVGSREEGPQAAPRGRAAPCGEAGPCEDACDLFPFDAPPPEWDNAFWTGGEAERHAPVERFRYLLDQAVRLHEFIAARLADRRVDIVMERRILEALDRLGGLLRSTRLTTLFPQFNERLTRLKDGICDEIPALADATLKTFLRMLSTGDLREESYEREGGMGFFFSSGSQYDLSGRITECAARIRTGLEELCARSERFRLTGEPS